ncbi:eukaryotic translation initiation factor 4 gamma 1-like isoform X2 [Macrosteles quadrilineatus]|uniref:eukaryotic translation initiation factor 4 gamma 1-like isoform X2 n=1 Tax=Macrosteles quadrilineatus TaxID=74068 RepID=UPI0023E2A961|nr:eukaryotic translation initiation factor 4 gamma 1-like isoform X2 [Macrosteles quadrilineatus]
MVSRYSDNTHFFPPHHFRIVLNQPRENNGGFHVTGNQYGAGQVQGGGGQNRQGPPQAQSQQQPPPTPNTPPGIHGDMNKQPLIPNQPGTQINFVRGIHNSPFPFTRPTMASQQQMRPHNHRQPMPGLYPMSGIVTQAPGQPITAQVLPGYPATVMYNPGPRQNTPYSQGQFIMQPQNYYQAAGPYYPAVIPPQFPGLSSGGPSPQAAGQGSVPMMRPAIVPAPSMAPPPTKQEPKKRTHAIPIINPESGDEVLPDNENRSNNNNITPTRSNDSSARETPQPNSGIPQQDNNVAADFAARVAARAGEPNTPAQSPSEQSLTPSDSEHKQSSAVPISEKQYSMSLLYMNSEEFVPRSQKQQPSEPIVVEEPPVQHVPTVSAETNSPAIDLQRSKDYPSLKSTPPVQSPARGNNKKKVAEPVVPQPQPENKKVVRTSVPKEELPKEKREKVRSVSKEQSPSPSPVAVAEVSSSHVEPIAAAKPVTTVPVAIISMPQSASDDLPAVKTLQHQNGETPVPESTVAVDGSKAARQKPKGNKKMRDQKLNLKGVDKEGSDMDAFVDTSEEKERPSTPPASPPPTSPPAIVPALEDKIKEDLEEKEDKQEKLVAAKNEENAKVSAMTIEDVEKTEEKKPPRLTLRLSYTRDQWSPLNPDGKKKYERDFLMDLKGEPQSNVKPDNLPDVVAVIRDASLLKNSQSMHFMNNRNADFRGLMPEFLRNSQSQRGPLPKGRNSQQGKGGKNQNPKVIHMSLSRQEDVKLRTAENAWKPQRLESDAGKDEEQKDTEKLYKDVRGILNKLTPQKFDTLMKKFMILPINSEERLKGVIGLIFEKAVDEPNFSKAYANMCKVCSRIEVSKVENGAEQKVNFRKLLITRCQTEFERNKSSELDAAKWLKEINNCTDPEQKKELQLQYEEKERTLRKKSVGNIRFIGELFKLGMLTPAIMYRCIEHLLSTPDEESLECLCKLLTTIGKDLEYGQQNQKQPPPGVLNPYFQRMAELAQKREGSKVSSRVRFMLQDVIELRQSKWVPRREDNNPKTIEQITKEAERESMEMSIALQQHPPPRMNRQDRGDDRKRNNRGGNNQSDNDGWVSVAPSSRFHSKGPAFEASKMQNMVKNEMADLNSLSLGGRSQFIFQTTSKSMENKSAPVFTTTNVYSALQQEKKQPPQPSMNNRRMTPTPSIEKDRERQRMMQGLEGDGRNSRGSSMQRERQTPLSSQPASRESSVPRQPDNKESERRDKRDDKVDEERLERQTQTIFDEYLGNLSSVEDVKVDVESIFHDNKIGSFISRGLELALEKKAGAQKRIGELFTALMDYGVFTPEVFVDQLNLIYEASEEIAIDVPKIWELQAQVIVPILAAEKINFSHIKAACSPVLNTRPAVKLLVPILKLLAEEKKPGFVRKVWDSSNVSLKDFIPADLNVDAFIKENSLEYLTGEPPQYEPSSQMPMDQVQEKITRLMQSNTSCDNIFQIISSNVGDKVESLQFIRALITAICTACIGSTFSVDQARFKEYKKLIQRYVDNREDRELACLSSVQILSNKLDHPGGLLLHIFNLFLEHNLISSESFLKWRDDESEKLENKGVSVLSLASFFNALEDNESEDENS